MKNIENDLREGSVQEKSLRDESVLPDKRISLLGKEILVFREVTSTNTVAMRLARAGAADNIMVLGIKQNAGQGRRGRSWTCPPGRGVMTSLILKPEIEWQMIPLLNLLCGVAVAETVQKTTGREAGIKWPNDVVLNGRKICGILAQSSFAKSGPQAVVVGFGLNVNLESWHLPEDCRETSTSLKLEIGYKISRFELLKQFIISWNEHYRRFIEEGYPYLRQKWLANNVTLGRTVWINRDKGNDAAGSGDGTGNSLKSASEDVLEGVAADLSERGGLIIRFADGREEEFMAEDLSLGKSHYNKNAQR